MWVNIYSRRFGLEFTYSKLPVASMSTATYCRYHTLIGKRIAGKTAASTWCQLSWCLNLVPKLSGAKMISYKPTEYQRIMS